MTYCWLDQHIKNTLWHIHIMCISLSINHKFFLWTAHICGLRQNIQDIYISVFGWCLFKEDILALYRGKTVLSSTKHLPSPHLQTQRACLQLHWNQSLLLGLVCCCQAQTTPFGSLFHFSIPKEILLVENAINLRLTNSNSVPYLSKLDCLQHQDT